MIRKGSSTNAMINPDLEYDSSAFTKSDGQYIFTHRALGADMFRYSWNFAQNWTNWTSWEDTTSITANLFENDENWWSGQHVMVQCTLFRSLFQWINLNVIHI